MMTLSQQIQALQAQHDHPVHLPDGTIRYYRRKEVAEEAEQRVALGKEPPPASKRLAPFGEGISRLKGGGYEVYLLGSCIADDVPTLEEAVELWWQIEREWHQTAREDKALRELDGRYYEGVQYDEDGYKILNPRIRQILNG